MECYNPYDLNCKSSGVCFSLWRQCDGYNDCEDGSDEENCTSKECYNPYDLKCKSSGVCFSSWRQCNGLDDCEDGSDEDNCTSKECYNPYDLKCKSSGVCFSLWRQCDGYNDCEDGSDEESCTNQGPCAEQGLWQCDVYTRTCINQTSVCDGNEDCQFGTDEKNCASVPKDCFFTCRDNVTCLPTRQLGDGQKDCTDGEDERPGDVEQALTEMWGSCSYNCSSVYGNASCVPDAFSCDGDADCLEEEDEQGCIEHIYIIYNRASLDGYSSGGADGSAGDMSTQTSATRTAGTTQNYVETAECPTFYCGLSSSMEPSCVQDHLICDGQPDCTLGEDEQGCGNADDTPTQATITSTAGTTTQDSGETAECPTFYCSLSGSTDPSCVQDHLICDGQPDCTTTQDSGEEAECPTFYCSLSGSTDLSCVQDHLICDGQLDCVLGEDELGCGKADDTSTQATITSTAGATTHDSGETAECPTFYCGLPGSMDPSCVQDHLICDGQLDCALGEDEQGCSHEDDTSTQTDPTPSNEPVSYGEQTGFYVGNHGSKNQPVVWLTAAVLGCLIFYRQYF
uniref:Uncharacterized protein n=1 Tax=Branchiostoma floridae TaxID=7739 RepID=C3Y9M6_BRAFL|eukprot:XP_002607272.1 hypothetical protein BRAFLDRAFT_88220 [Branchiostoma floridae]